MRWLDVEGLSPCPNPRRSLNPWRPDMAVPFMVGIAGGTGSGKTTLADKLIGALNREAVLIRHDWYYFDRSHQTPEEIARVNFDEPAALDNELLVGHLRQLKHGRAVECPDYDFKKHTSTRGVFKLEPRPIVIAEGILLFCEPRLRDEFDLRIFVDTDDDIRLMRRIKRDIQERNRDLVSVERQYFQTVRPMHRLHVEPSRQHAHLIVPEGGGNTQALDVIAGRLLFLLQQSRR